MNMSCISVNTKVCLILHDINKKKIYKKSYGQMDIKR